MKATALLLLCTVAVALAIFPQTGEQGLFVQFQQWMKEHRKTYYTQAEFNSRLLKFQENTRLIRELNAKSPEARFAHNKFSDLSPKEFKAIYLNAKIKPRTNVTVLPTPQVSAPTSFDWRKHGKVTPVKDQGQCGSCWAFSATENVESVWMIAHGLTSENMTTLSPQQIVDCDTEDAGCNGGDTITAFEYIIHAGGLEPEKDYPYTAEDGTCDFHKDKVYAKIIGYKYATDPNKPDESVMMKNLNAWAPLSICVDAAKWQFYQSGVLKASQCGDDLDHCVQAVGYDMDASTPYWIVRNSWGDTWGENGYIRLEYGKNTCGLADEATTAVV